MLPNLFSLSHPPSIPDLPPGDTTILIIGAVILVLIVLGGIFWQSRRLK